ncbi:OLC1v1030128C1 [Oldenlandia corymbosa var. corymbosa]|uniref:Enhancer of polycomb-like protein n=1 Tax=Oldenlandia corymbosa var. corymbosa TaxID=529605 RepID=A0AAV1CFC0_OLDCO|nr:OLC1v1030128C1 [Oldenlandia corymbosa var. corymbosa]
MESRIRNTSAVLGLGVAKKTKSLDLQSIYKSKVSKEGLPKIEKFPVQNGGEAKDGSENKKKKKRKNGGNEVALAGVEPVTKKSKKTVDEGRAVDVQPGLVSVDSGRPLTDLSRKNGLNGLALSLGGSGHVIRVPRRPRGFVGRKKTEGNQSIKSSGPNSSVSQGARSNGELRKVESSGSSSAEPASDDKISKSGSGVGDNVGVPKSTRKRNTRELKVSRNVGEVGESRMAGEVKENTIVAEVKESKTGGEVKESRTTGEVKESENGVEVKEIENGGVMKGNGAELKEGKKAGEMKKSRIGKLSSLQCAKEEDGDHVVNNGNTSCRKRQRKRKKRMDMASGNETVQEKVEHSVENHVMAFDDFQDDDDDEEKLEQNAARMLSSRFDPKCTGFIAEDISSGRLSNNATSFSGSSVSRRGGSVRSSKSKDANRVLRPRKQLNDKGQSRKRRHFYEIIANNLDASWFLNRRIKVFWPLDESWYFGLVNDYNPEIKLHHIKYDDRDEEWIDLQNEKFKLLLLPSEVPGRVEKRKFRAYENSGDKRKKDREDDGCYEGRYLDSEPIISWLPRSSHRATPGHLKEQKTPQLSLSGQSHRSDDTDTDVGCFARDGNKSYYEASLPDNSTDGERAKSSLLGSPSSSNGSKPVVYVRRRLNKRREGFSPLRGNNKSRVAPVQNIMSYADDEDWLHLWEGSDDYKVCLKFDEKLWSLDDQGLLKLRVPLGELKGFRLNVCLPVLPFQECSVLADHLGHLAYTHSLFRHHNGVMMTTWPEVSLEMLFVDNIIGLRFLLFEGCLKLAVELFSLILTVFNQSSGEWKFFDTELPITSIRFKLSITRDLRKQKEFAFYSFSKLKQSKWLYLDSKLQRHCLFSRQLPVSECTYDNIRTLEHGSYQSDTPADGPGYFPFKKRLMKDLLPLGPTREFSSKMITRSAVHSSIKSGQIPTFALPFTAAPTFFLSLHLQLLMERNFASIGLQDDSSQRSLENSLVAIEPAAVHSPVHESCQGNFKVRFVNSEEGEGAHTKSAQNLDCAKSIAVLDSSSSMDLEMNAAEGIVYPKKRVSRKQESKQKVVAPVSSERYSSLATLSIELPSSDHIDKPVNGKVNISKHVSDLAGNSSDGVVQSPYQTCLRRSWRRDRNDSSSPLGDLSPTLADGKSVFVGNGFGSGPKKPRTRMRYSMPGGGYDSHLKYKSLNPRSLSHKRIWKSTEKRVPEGLIRSQKDLELMACDANVLVTLGDKGWRECGARIVLELVDQSEWRIAVRVSGVTKYSHKVDHVLQPGSTNRYTHAMMWKGGKDWVLEFPDRNQWVIFKEMYEECHNRNMRAATVKNIPIPGVRLIEESDDFMSDVHFFRNPAMYIRQDETDVEMAMNPLRILYDMDSDDEDWIVESGNFLSTNDNSFRERSCELFEKVVDVLEKFAYSQQRDQFSVDELEDLTVGICPCETVKDIYEHWRHKRQKKGMPLIRHFQPPLWERYQQQVKEWEQAVARTSAASAVGSKEKATLIERPPMFAFCLKPRGLEVPNKGSKQRSHRRFPVSGHSHAFGDQDGFHTFGRRLNGFSVGEERNLYSGYSHEFSDSSPSLQASARVFSPRDAGGGLGFISLNNDVTEWNHYPKYPGNKQKKNGLLSSPGSVKLVPYPQRTVGMKNGVHRWPMDLPEWPSQKHYSEGSLRHGMELWDDSDLHEFRLRDSSGAAQHALYMAKLKRENAIRLLYKADLAIHKAHVALMTAEAKKDAFESSNGGG